MQHTAQRKVRYGPVGPLRVHLHVYALSQTLSSSLELWSQCWFTLVPQNWSRLDQLSAGLPLIMHSGKIDS